ncbi:hypothetical protein EJ08DRAFT_495307 [Tothia fuscella]|uniref:Uncharacterized protein n=1 Tax=Tothia fuscella TaxID=1048955 RepID=A0A9P4NYU9_9PEZI|nr:hypothetical protein EJ08DRAFT_495307 [Tothia fuscella]
MPLDHADDNTASKTDSCHRCMFLTLPRELRDQIYQNALIEEKAVEFKMKCYPGLLLVNKQISEEAFPIYVKKNSFKLHIPGHRIQDPEGLRLFRKMLTVHNLYKHVTGLHLPHFAYQNYTIIDSRRQLEFIPQCPNIRKLWLFINTDYVSKIMDQTGLATFRRSFLS